MDWIKQKNSIDGRNDMSGIFSKEAWMKVRTYRSSFALGLWNIVQGGGDRRDAVTFAWHFVWVDGEK